MCAVVEDAAFVIKVFKEEIQSGDALGESFFDARPFCVGDDAWQQVVGENAFGAFGAAVDGQGDALVQEGEVGNLLAGSSRSRVSYLRPGYAA